MALTMNESDHIREAMGDRESPLSPLATLLRWKTTRGAEIRT
jgi:hypothetical protein